MAYENLCVSCFGDRGSGTVCPHCGYLESGDRKRMLLPARYVLQNRYVVGEMLTADKNAVSYKALDTAQRRIVEIQEYFPREYTCRDAQSARLRITVPEYERNVRKDVDTIHDNAQKMRQFDHSENIVHIFDSFKENDTVYIVSEYLEGRLVSDYLNDCGGKLDLDTALAIITPVLDGLTQIHNADLVHRAITPKNILITVDNKIKIINFRFLKEASPYQPNQMTVYFTPGYAPPEQYSSKGRAGRFTDIYSAGATLYRMLTGKAPRDALARLSGSTLDTAALLDPCVPEYVGLAIEKAMEMNEDMRFKTAADFKNCLLGKAEVVNIDNVIRQTQSRKKLRRMIAALVVLLLAAAGVWIYVLSNRG